MGAARRFLLLVVVSATLVSCSPNDGGPVTLYSEPALDGVVVCGTGPVYTGTLAGSSVNIGDDIVNAVMRCVVSFDLGSLPVDAQIDSATLWMYQGAGQSASGNSYGEAPGLGTVLVDNIAYDEFTSWADLWNPVTCTGTDIGIGPLASLFSPNTWHEIDVTPSAQFEYSDYHNGRLQFRVYHHYESNSDGVEDSDEWIMGDSPTNRPKLVIEYH